MLEKAWAKIHGSYRRVEGGSTAMTIRDLTGAPGAIYVTADQKDLWNMIKEADEKNHIMCASVD